jgi:hypothetical protein
MPVVQQEVRRLEQEVRQAMVATEVRVVLAARAAALQQVETEVQAAMAARAAALQQVATAAPRATVARQARAEAEVPLAECSA